MDNEKVPAAMQDNVTQDDVTEADKAAVTAFHNKQAARILAGDKTLGDNRDCIEQAFAAHRLASAAQPEVKTLVAAADEAMQVIWQYKNDLHFPPSSDSMGRRLARASEVATQVERALAAYREAQP